MEHREIMLMPYSHADYAWMYSRRWHEERYALILNEVLDTMAQDPDYRWYLDSYFTFLEPALTRNFERLPELKRRVHEGRIAVCGGYTNIRPSMVGEETLVRNMLIGRETFRKQFPDADLSVWAADVDVSVGPGQLPQILSGAGYRYLRFMRPHVGLSRKGIPLTFVWKAPDGSSVLCSRGSYCGLYDLNPHANAEILVRYDDELNPAHLLWLNRGMDDTRPGRTAYSDEPVDLHAFMREWNEEKNISIAFGTPVDFFGKLAATAPDLPVVAGPLDPCEVAYNVGWGGNEGLFAYRHTNDQLLVRAETTAALALCLGVEGDHRVSADLWRRHLQYCSHASQFSFQSDFEALQNLAMEVRSTAARIDAEARRAVVSAFDIPAHPTAVFYNPIPRQRVELVHTDLVFPTHAPDEFHLEDQDGRVVPFDITATNDWGGGRAWEHQVVAEVHLPPCGVATLFVRRGGGRAGQTEHAERTKPYERTRQPGPAVDFHAEEGEIVAGASADNPLGRLVLYHVDTNRGSLHVGPIVNTQTVEWKSVEPGPGNRFYETLVCRGVLGTHPVSKRVRTYADQARVDVEIDIDWRGDDGFVTLEWPKYSGAVPVGDTPFHVEEKDMSREPFGTVEEGPEVAGWNSNMERQRQGLFFAKSFVAQDGAGAGGCAYVNSDATHYYLDLGDRLGNVLLNDVSRIRGSMSRFINRLTRPIGRQTFHSRWIFYEDDRQSSCIPAQVERTLKPPIAVDTAGIRNGTRPASDGLLRVEPENVIMTAFYQNGEDWVLRCYESVGRDTTARVFFPTDVTTAQLTSLDGATATDEAGVEINGPAVSFALPAYRIATLAVSFQPRA